MKADQAVFWRVISGLMALVVSLLFYWLTTVKPGYTAALIFVSVAAQLLIYVAYKNRFP